MQIATIGVERNRGRRPRATHHRSIALFRADRSLPTLAAIDGSGDTEHGARVLARRPPCGINETIGAEREARRAFAHPPLGFQLRRVRRLSCPSRDRWTRPLYGRLPTRNEPDHTTHRENDFIFGHHVSICASSSTRE